MARDLDFSLAGFKRYKKIAIMMGCRNGENVAANEKSASGAQDISRMAIQPDKLSRSSRA